MPRCLSNGGESPLSPAVAEVRQPRILTGFHLEAPGTARAPPCAVHGRSATIQRFLPVPRGRPRHRGCPDRSGRPSAALATSTADNSPVGWPEDGRSSSGSPLVRRSGCFFLSAIPTSSRRGRGPWWCSHHRFTHCTTAPVTDCLRPYLGREGRTSAARRRAGGGPASRSCWLRTLGGSER